MKKRALSWLLALTMLLTLAPQALPTWASAAGTDESGSKTETKLSANTYSALGLSRDVDTTGLDDGKQPYGKAEPGNTVATNVINELYVNFNGSIHYGWSILDNIPMEFKDGQNITWTSPDNFHGAMGFWRPGQQGVHYKDGASSYGALFGHNGKTVAAHNEKIGDIPSKSISSANKHLTYQYSKSEAFSPNTGKDNYVAEMTIDSGSQVNLYIYQVEGGNKRYVRSKFVCYASESGGNASDKTNIIYNWEYDAMYDIAAGDMDGDGYDEIAVYASNKVYVYSFVNGVLSSPIEKATAAPSGVNENNGKYKKLKTAVVTLAFGDLNADDKDELVIAENMTYGSSNPVEDNKVGIYALEGSTLKPKNNITLHIPSTGTPFTSGVRIRYANVATGDIDGDYQDELIIAGYISANGNGQCSKENVAYMVVKGDSKNNFENSGWKKANHTIDLLDRVVDNKDQLIPPVALTCAATQGVGHAEQLFLGGWLYSVNLGTSKNLSDVTLTDLTRISTNREYKKDNGNKANKEEIFVVNVVAGNFNGNRNGQEQIVYAFGMKHDDSDRYWYDIGYINKKEPGDTNANSSSGYWYGQEQVMNYESSYNRDQNKSRASLYLSLAAVDCDKDSTLMRYKGQTVTWTKPEVLTVLQSAPYFQDLEDTRGYLDQGQTGLGKSKAAGDKVTAGGSLSLGTYVSFEQDFSVFGVKVASIEAEAQSKNSFTYAYEETKKKETEINYSGSAGDDYAVVYAVPYMEYQYETWVPEYTLPASKNEEYYKYIDNYLSGKLKNWSTIKSDPSKLSAERTKAEKELGIRPNMTVEGSWQPSSVMVPMEPAKVLITVDDYDEIAEQTEGLEPIRGNILNSTPGDPATYDAVGARSNDFHAIGNQQKVTTGEGGNITVTETSTTEKSHDFEYSYEFEAKVGAGAGGLTVGVLAGFGANAGGGISTSSSKSYSATVDNLPKDASNYGFSWQFGYRKAKLNNNDVLVLEYQIKDVAQLPSPPKNLRVESVTSDSVTLSWDPVTGAGAYKIYQLDSTGKTYRMKTLAGTATSWTNTGLSSNTSYTYVAKTITQDGQESLTSASVHAGTLEKDKENFKILTQPTDQTSEATAGSQLQFTVTAEYRNDDGRQNELNYQWETYNTTTRKWETVNGAESQTLTVTVTDQNDGKRYRCQVYSSAILYLYSKEVTLKVGRSTTETSLTATPTGVIKSAYMEEQEEYVTENGQQVYEQKAKTEGEYTLYSYSYQDTDDQTQKVTVYAKKTGTATDYYASKTDTQPLSKATKKILTYGDSSQDITTIGAGESVTDKAYTVTQEEGGGSEAAVTYTATTKYKLDTDGKKILYYCPANTTDKTEAFWFVEVTDKGTDGQNTTTTYYAEVEDVVKLQVTDTLLIDEDQLQLETVDDTTKPVKRTVQVNQDGDTVTLTANVGKKNTGDQTIDGSVTFKIVNTTGDGGVTETVQVGTHGKATMNWKPTTAGVYVVTAIYSGSEMFKESQSQSYTINVVTPGEQKLVLSGENMTYGDTQELKATLFDGKSDSESTTGVSAKPVTVTYAVTRDGTAVTDEITAEGKFTPTQAGTYTITATYTLPNDTTTTENNASGDAGDTPSTTQNTITTTKVIVVGRKTVKIVPKVVQGTDGKTITYDLPGVPEADQSAIRAAIVTSCTGLTNGAKAGIYPIVVKYNENNSINSKYLIVCDNDQKYEVKGDVVHVTNATTDSNGKVKLQYTDSKGNTYDVGENGQSLDVPKGVKLTATAMPNVGYQVEKWTEKVGDNTEALIFSSTDVYNTSNVITKEDLQTKYSIKADFTLTYYNLKMGFATGSSGSIIAKYLNDAGTEGAIFYDSNSPSLTPTTATQQLSPLKKVRITATPAAGRVISGWKIYSDTDSEGILVKNDDGTTYTGNTYTVSSINANTKIEIQTETKAAKTIKVTLVGQDGANLGSQASVSFNAKEVTSVDGTYTYTTAQHDNVVINLTTPDSLIVDSWKIGDTEQNVGTLSNNKKTLSISDLQLTADSLDLTVHCKAPNSYPVTVTQKIGETTVTDAADITIKKNGTDDTVNWSSSDDNKVPEATILRVIIQEKDGYELQSVSCNGTVQTTQDTEGGKAFTIDGVHADVNIVATFVKLDEYTVTFSVVDTNGDEAGGTNGTLTATAERKGKEYPGFKTEDIVYAGSTVTFTAKAYNGYRVKEWQVDGAVYTDAGTNTSLTLTPTKNTEVTVQFMEKGNQLTFNAEDTNGIIENVKVGDENVEFSGGFTLEAGAAVTVTAKPNPGYEVNEWKVDGTPVKDATGNTYVYTADGTTGAAISVTFQPVKYSITWGGTNGTVTAAGYDGNSAEIRGGKALTFTATPANGYKFDHWTVNGVKSEGAMNPLAWTVPHGQAETTPVNSYEIRAVFVSDEQTHTVTYTVNDAAGGTVTTESGNNGSITVAAGTNLTFTAHPNQYYHVQAWMLDAQTVDGTANQLTYTLNNVRATHTVTVVFSKAVSYDVGYAVTDEDNGSLSATENGTALTLGAKQQKAVSAGAKLVFTAAPNSNNMVAEWSVNDTPVTRTNMTELGVKMDHYLSNTLTIESLDKAVTVKVKFKTYEAVSIPTSDTGYMITTDKRIPMETYIGAPTNEIRKNGDLTFTVKPDGTKHYMTIGTLVINGYDCIANKVTDETKYNAKCDSVSAKKNDDGSYTVTITNVKDEVEKTIVAHQVIVGGLTVPAAFAGKEELNSAEKIRTKLEASFTGSKDGMAFYDIALKYYDGTQWVDVNETNFPANGVDVVLPYPTGTNKQDRFQIVHMLTHSGHEGEIERITASNETDGLHFHVNSLSPFGVSWVKYVAPTPGGGGGGGGAVSTYTLTFDTNGGSAIDKITKDSGTTIDLAAYKPTRAGYTFAGWFSDKALTKTVTSVKLTANTTVYAKWTQNGGTAENPFVDVKEGAYYYDAVLWAVEQKITSGTSATTFSPDASCTRAQMVTFLWRAAGSPKVENGKNPFTDVKADAYYYDAVLWAVEKGVTSGTSATTFSPDATVTRGQTVTFLYRNAGSPEVSGTMPFTDVEADAYYAKAVQWAVQQKITTGTSETTFSPMSDCTRGQIVTFLYRAK